jgi:hypothetical protein
MGRLRDALISSFYQKVKSFYVLVVLMLLAGIAHAQYCPPPNIWSYTQYCVKNGVCTEKITAYYYYGENTCEHLCKTISGYWENQLPGYSACQDGLYSRPAGWCSAIVSHNSPPQLTNKIGGCDQLYYGECSSEYQQVTAFNSAHPDMSSWAYFTTTSGGTEYKCIAYYVDTQGDAWEMTVGAYDTVNPVNNPNCMTKTAFDARNNTDCAHAPDANDTCTTAQYGSPGATTETDECRSGAAPGTGATCSNL